MAKEEQYSNPIYEARDEKIISQQDGMSTVRLGRFLKPFVKSINQAVEIPNTPLLSEIFSHNLQQWPSKVVFKSWKLPERKWKEWIDRLAVKYGVIWKQSGICDAIMSSIYEIRCNHDLVIGLSEFWCPETNTFAFPWGEATITLEDMMILGGFPVLGEPVTSPLKGELVKIEEELNKKRMEMSRSQSRKATHSGWMRYYMGKESEFEHVAFLSLWLSRYVFPFAEETIGKHVFPVAVHLSQGMPMALAPAVLASLYRNLRLLREQAMSSSESIIISGPFQLVQLWVCERFPLLGPSSPNLLKPGEPRVARWHKLTSKINLPLVRSALRLADNFQWRPFAANLENWRHLSYYKETEQVLLYCSSLDEELRSFVQCLRAFELVGIDCNKEKYIPHRVAMQFGLDQDLPSDFSSLNFIRENVRFFVPPRTFEPGVSARYFNWWKKTKLAREEAVKDILVQQKFLKNPNELPSVWPEKNKDDDHASVASKRMKKLKNVTQVSTKSTRQESHASVSRKFYPSIILDDSSEESEEDLPFSTVLRTSVTNRTTAKSNKLQPVQAEKNDDDCLTSVASRSLKDSQKLSQVSANSNGEESHASVPSKIKKRMIRDSSDEDNLLISEFLKHRAGPADRTSPHKAYPCNQSQDVVSPTSSAAIETSRKRKSSTTTKGNRLVDGVAEEVERKASDSTNASNGVAKEVKRKANASNGVAKEGRKKKAGESLNNIETTRSKIQKLGLEVRVQKLEKLMGVILE